LNIKQYGATACLILTAMIWGVAFVAQNASVDLMGALTYGGTRFLLGAAALIPVIIVFERGKTDSKSRRSTLLCGSVTGLVLFAAVTLQQYGIELTRSAGKAGFITGLYIVFVPVTGIFMRQRASVFTWLGVAFALAGLYFLSVTEGFGSIGGGDLLLVAGAVCWTLHIIVIDRFSTRVRTLRFCCVQFGVCGMLSLIGAFLLEDISINIISNGLLPILYGGLLSVGVAYTLQTIGQKRVPPARAAIIFSMESLFAVLGGAVISGERLTLRGYLGCALILSGILISQIKQNSTANKKENTLQ